MRKACRTAEETPLLSAGTAPSAASIVVGSTRPRPSPERAIQASGFDYVLFMQELRLDDRELAFFCTLTTFGTPRDVTLAELTIVAFYPANRETAKALRC
jgi:hypothetical protein